ncbi:MAG: lipopolysaccharide biosynthesis protein, partial [Acidiphilium sp. 21-62-4]
ILRIRDAIARRMALNPTSDLWRQLLLSGYPFIKRELLRDNPTRVEDVGDWADMLKTTLEADPDPIRAELRLMLKGGAP